MNPENTPTPEETPAQPQPVETPQIDTPPVPPPVPTESIQAPRIHSSIEAITEPGEEIVFRTKKHPFGIIVMYLQAILGFVLAGGLMLYLLPSFFGADQQTEVRAWALVGLGFFGLIMFVILLLVTYVYYSNELILTNRNVTQIIRNGLFDKQVSQLSLNNIEDVTAEKHGIFPMLFNYGQVRVETAGEQNNFHFRYCPDPNHYGQLLLDTRAICQRRGGNSPPH